MSKGRSFENQIADQDKHDIPSLRKMSTSFSRSHEYWLIRCNRGKAEKAMRSKLLIDAEIERRVKKEL